MQKKKKSIPVNQFVDDFNLGISIEKINFKDLPAIDNLGRPERHDCHSFFLIESGTVTIEIDFKKFNIKPSTIIYMHPYQVHRITSFKNVIVTCWGINNENLNPQYLKFLEDITPAKPLSLQKETFTIFSEAASVCLKFSERKSDKLYYLLLKDCCNALIALVVSQYLGQSKSANKLTRFDSITKAFKSSLEINFAAIKQPAAYAKILNISLAYLNECVKNTTGFPVSYNIQQRIVLEAKRLLYHSGKSVKEISGELGYDDYPYFSRLFTKVAGMTPMSFRKKNRE